MLLSSITDRVFFPMQFLLRPACAQLTAPTVPSYSPEDSVTAKESISRSAQRNSSRRENPRRQFVFAGGQRRPRRNRRRPGNRSPFPRKHPLTGWLSRPRLDEVFSGASMVVVPSRYEPFGLVAARSYANGSPRSCGQRRRTIRVCNCPVRWNPGLDPLTPGLGQCVRRPGK